jgi:large subunit ribosomal protein L32
MPNPRRRHSKTRRDKRRTHDKSSAPVSAICSNCGSLHVYHRICPECGYYRGSLVLEKKAKV